MLSIDTDFLKQFTESPSVGTACLPALNLMKSRFGEDYETTFVSDGFCLFQRKGATPASLRTVFVAHADEVGGIIYGRESRESRESRDLYASRCWGNIPQVFADAKLQAYDYLSEDAADSFPVTGRVVVAGGDERLAVSSDHEIRPYRTVFTFDTETSIEGDVIRGKALDPRVTTFAVMEAVRALDSPEFGAMIVMAEECAMDVARKGVQFLNRFAPNLKLIANADVPALQNIGEGRLDLPAIRIFEGRNFIDPSFGIRTADRLLSQGVKLHLSAARSGSQTLLFTPLAPTLSIALPSDGIHVPSYTMSLTGAQRCIDLLTAIGELKV